MGSEIRQRMVREATPEEKERHRAPRDEIERELPELKQWARAAAAQGIGTGSQSGRCLAASRGTRRRSDRSLRG